MAGARGSSRPPARRGPYSVMRRRSSARCGETAESSLDLVTRSIRNSNPAARLGWHASSTWAPASLSSRVKVVAAISGTMRDNTSAPADEEHAQHDQGDERSEERRVGKE